MERSDDEKNVVEKEDEESPKSSDVSKKAKKRKDKKKKDAPLETVTDVSHKPVKADIREMLAKLSVAEETDKGKHLFWDTQPVPKLEDDVQEFGPIEPPKEEIRVAPYSLPANYEWDEVDILDADQLSELYSLLNENYVEDDDNLFRFDYSKEFLFWALTPPGWEQVWHCGIRVATSRKLVGFISAIPAHIRVKEHKQLMVEINFLCVHKKLRSKRMAPVLIKEITRRVNQEGIFQATYTAGVLLPKPVAACRYWHRSLNPKKLVDIEFSHIPRKMTMQRMIKLYRLPESPKTPGLRPMEERHVKDAHRILNEYLKKFTFAPFFETTEEFAHWMLPREGVIDTYVVEDSETHEVTDMISFYHLPSTVVKHRVYKKLNSAYSFYNVATKTPLRELMNDGLIVAKKQDCDVFNALDVMDNSSFLEDLKFGIGDGNLHYYLYNYKCPQLKPQQV